MLLLHRRWCGQGLNLKIAPILLQSTVTFENRSHFLGEVLIVVLFLVITMQRLNVTSKFKHCKSLLSVTEHAV